ncbi:MAG: hypothetical protein GY884_08025 [Proteobacteria bacterium]|nr:hypothetical protein [Pseudomonadota bacterium]
MAEPVIVGVRHHSPACAHVVRHTIETVKPRHVLIEGPADMNERIDELLLDHAPPVAIFSYLHSANRSHASWTPFCAYSPEWVALREGAAAGAQVRFMDLPAWSRSFEDVRNRYSDRVFDRAAVGTARLCRELGVDGSDALWDHLFEQPEPVAEVAERLHTYFVELRGQVPAGVDTSREEFMARCIRTAMDDGPVVVVCGGWHAPALAETWRSAPVGWPEVPLVEDARIGSYLVPYSDRRLDSFIGYQSGMPSPAWYQAVWDHGHDQAAEAMLERAVTRLRGKRQIVSPADVIATWTLACGLKDLRGHGAVGRVDLLDALAGALVKHALDQPVPWSGRGRIQGGTDATLVEVVAAFSGDAVGRLHPDTPRPPLLHDVRAQLEAHDLVPRRQGREVKLDLARHAPRSRVLHRLRVLGVGGFTRTRGPEGPADPVLGETWILTVSPNVESELIEASAFGATLEQAALAKLEAALLDVTDVTELAETLLTAVFIGIDGVAERVLSVLRLAVEDCSDLTALGRALAALLSVWRHETLLIAAQHGVIEAAFGRALWLVEAVNGPQVCADRGRIDAMVSLAEVVRFGAATALRDAAASVMARRSLDAEAPPDVRGAALGFLWATGDPAGEADAVRAVGLAGGPEPLGDFLAGLFAVAREEVVHADGLLTAIDARVRELDAQGFLVGLPAMRLAFEYFPPRERRMLADRVAAIHGVSGRELTRLAVDAQVLSQALQVEADVAALLEAHGL